jgi:hypothetical protein
MIVRRRNSLSATTKRPRLTSVAPTTEKICQNRVVDAASGRRSKMRAHVLIAMTIMAQEGAAAPATALEDRACGMLRGQLLPMSYENSRDDTVRYDPEVTSRRYLEHRFQYTRLTGARGAPFVFFSGVAHYVDASDPRRVRKEAVRGALADAGYFAEKEWRHSGSLSDIDTNGTLQTDAVVSGVSSALAYMAIGAPLDAALRGGSRQNAIPFPIVRGTQSFDSWYACQSCLPGGGGVSRQSLAGARFAAIGSRIYVITTVPRVWVAELAEAGRVRRYFSCRKALD